MSSLPAWLRRVLIYTGLFAATLLARALSWRISLINPDEHAFILAAREVLAGHLPYTTLFDNKPAGLSVLLALVMGAFGKTLLSVRVFGAACVFAASVFLFETVLLLSLRRVEAIAAGLLYIAFSTVFGGAATMAEIMVAPFSCFGILLLSRLLIRQSRPGARWLIFGAGFAFGLAVWIKTVPVVPGFGMGGLVLLHGLVIDRIAFRESALRGLLLAAALVLPTVLTACVFALAGSFGVFAYANFGFMTAYVQHSAAEYMALHLATIAAGLWPLLLLFAAGLGMDAAALRTRPALRLGAVLPYAWLVTELVACAGPMRLYEHYFLMALPPLAMLAARTLARGSAKFARTPASAALACAAAALFVAFIPTVPALRQDALRLWKFPDSQRVAAAAVNRLLPANDRSLLVLSYDYLADYLYTETPWPTRVAIPPHLFDQTSLTNPDPLAPVQAALARHPNLILVDFTYLGQTATEGQRKAVNDVLACCYRDAAALSEFWRVSEGGGYHVADLHLFQRKPSAP